MTAAGDLNRRVSFARPTTDSDGEAAAHVPVLTRNARIQALKGGEAVQAQRLAGRQPAIITVRRDSLTETIDNGWQATDARKAGVKWDVSSAIVTEDLEWVEVQAVQLLGGDE